MGLFDSHTWKQCGRDGVWMDQATTPVLFPDYSVNKLINLHYFEADTSYHNCIYTCMSWLKGKWKHAWVHDLLSEILFYGLWNSIYEACADLVLNIGRAAIPKLQTTALRKSHSPHGTFHISIKIKPEVNSLIFPAGLLRNVCLGAASACHPSWFYTQITRQKRPSCVDFWADQLEK